MSKTGIPTCNSLSGKDEYYDGSGDSVGNLLGMGLNYSSSCISLLCCIVFAFIFLAVFFSTRKKCAVGVKDCTPNSGWNAGTILLLIIMTLFLISTIVNTISMYIKKNNLLKIIQKGKPCYSKDKNMVIK